MATITAAFENRRLRLESRPCRQAQHMTWARICVGAGLALAFFAAEPAAAHASALAIGTGGHDAWQTPTWEAYDAATAFSMMNLANMRTYRVDVSNSPQGFAALTKLVALGQTYNITIRPMLNVDSGLASDAYTIAKAFAASIPVWELGNELNLRGVSQFTNSINLMIAARAGIMQAAAETGVPLQTVINVTSGWGSPALDPVNATYPFIDQAISMGLAFDYISYHYYPGAIDSAGGWMKAYLDPLRKYGRPVFLNEANCAQIYSGDNGDSAACTLVMAQLLDVVQQEYSDLITEFDSYEIIDDPSIGGVEGHFGITFTLSQPKHNWKLEVSAAKNYAPFPVPIMVTTQGLTNSQFVEETYAAVLNRVPNAADLANWTNWLAGRPNGGRAKLIANGVNSTEFQNNAAVMDNQAFVARLYLAILGHPVPMAALITYGGGLDQGIFTRSQVEQILFASAEFAARAL